MVELRRHVDDSIWVRDPIVAGAPLNTLPAVRQGAVRAELVAGGATLETRMDYQRFGGDAGLGLPAATLAGCGLLAGLAPSTETAGVRLGFQARGGVTATDPQCRQGRFELGAGVRLEVPVAESRLTLFANGAVSGRGSPLVGSPNTRRGNRRIEVGVALAREIDEIPQRVAVTAFQAFDREAVTATDPRGRRATGVTLAYEHGIALPIAPGVNLRGTLVGEGHVARVVAARSTTELAAILRLRVAY